MSASEQRGRTLVLGIGNILMGDEGVGVEVLHRVARRKLPPDVDCLDGGTGSLVLLEPMQNAETVILIDATVDGNPAGTVTRLEPRFSRDYPRTLTAHDIGLKDLLDALYLLNASPRVILFAVSIEPLNEVGMGLSPALEATVEEIAAKVWDELQRVSGAQLASAS